MKKIEAIIKPFKLDDVKEALGAIGHPEAMALLREHAADAEEILRESCVVSLHMYDRAAFAAAGGCV